MGDRGHHSPYYGCIVKGEMKIEELQLKKIWDQQKNCGKLLVIEMQYPFSVSKHKIKDTE